MLPESFLNRPCDATRREFLRKSSTLAGSAILVSLDLSRLARADEAGKSMLGPAKDCYTIRGHHLFDMLGALGTGQSTHKTLGPVAMQIRANPKVPILVVVGEDDICAPCEWWDREKGLCKRSLDKYPDDNANSLTSDKNAIRVLGLKPGEEHKADELYRLIQAKVTKKVFAEEVCVACRLVNKCQETYEAKLAAVIKALG